jgi:phage shock protein PspC (stress-responsive transcriptional regulator)
MKNWLYRSLDDRVLTGVAGGMASRIGVNAWLVRIVWVGLTVFTGGLALVLYAVMARVVPDEATATRLDDCVTSSVDLPPVFTRTYSGTSRRVETLRSVDAGALARRGYYPRQQASQPGSRQDGIALAGIVVLVVSWIVALSIPYGRSGAATFGPVLIFGGTGLGLLIIVASFTSRRPDTLSVIYDHRVTLATAPPDAPVAPAGVDYGGNVDVRLATLMRLRATGAITDDEYQVRRSNILDEI